MSVNVWGLPKTKALKHLLLLLHERLGDGAFALLEQREGPLALTLCKPGLTDLSAYIYTYAQQPGAYGLHLEYPEYDGLRPPTEVREALPLEQVLDSLVIHFGP